jgi:phage virion morphogenesis protein
VSDLVVDLSRLLPVRRRLALLSPARMRQLLEVVASEVESQTRRRLHEEKTDPQGNPWDEWSNDYAARRAAKGGMLELEGYLRDSIAYEIQGDTILVGSNLVYAAVHQFGWEKGKVPARPYLGISAENLDDLGVLIAEELGRAL